MQCYWPLLFSRLWPLQTRAPQQHNRTVLAFAEFKAKAAEGVGLTCRVVILVPAFGPATMVGPGMAQNKMFRTILRPTLWRDVGPTPTAPGRLRTVWRPGRVLRGCGQPSNSGSSTSRRSRVASSSRFRRARMEDVDLRYGFSPVVGAQGLRRPYCARLLV